MTGMMSVSSCQHHQMLWERYRKSALPPHIRTPSSNCTRTLDNQVGPENTHGGNTNTGLRGSVCSAEACEDNGSCATHRSEERLSSNVSIFASVAIVVRFIVPDLPSLHALVIASRFRGNVVRK
jgi:hypothetical protein